MPVNTSAIFVIPVSEGEMLMVNINSTESLSLQIDGINFLCMINGKTQFEAVA